MKVDIWVINDLSRTCIYTCLLFLDAGFSEETGEPVHGYDTPDPQHLYGTVYTHVVCVVCCMYTDTITIAFIVDVICICTCTL